MKNTFAAFLSLFIFATTASASTFIYECSPESGNATDQTLKIVSKQLFVTTSDSLNGLTFKAVYDNSYQPRNGAQKVRYLGKEKGNNREVILYSQMLKGARMGYVQIRGNEDSYWSSEYKCFLK